MREFARLYAELDETTATNRKLDALQTYFSARRRSTQPGRCTFLAGGKPRQSSADQAAAPVRDRIRRRSTTGCSTSATTRSAIWPRPSPTSCRRRGTAATSACRLDGGTHPAAARRQPEHIRGALFAMWDETDWRERFLLMKLIGGGFRVGVSKLLVTRALAEVAGIDAKLIAQRLMGWTDGRVHPMPTATRS
jgi:DNA ligase-1